MIFPIKLGAILSAIGVIFAVIRKSVLFLSRMSDRLDRIERELHSTRLEVSEIDDRLIKLTTLHNVITSKQIEA